MSEPMVLASPPQDWRLPYTSDLAHRGSGKSRFAAGVGTGSGDGGSSSGVLAIPLGHLVATAAAGGGLPIGGIGEACSPIVGDSCNHGGAASSSPTDSPPSRPREMSAPSVGWRLRQQRGSARMTCSSVPAGGVGGPHGSNTTAAASMNRVQSETNFQQMIRTAKRLREECERDFNPAGAVAVRVPTDVLSSVAVAAPFPASGAAAWATWPSTAAAAVPITSDVAAVAAAEAAERPSQPPLGVVAMGAASALPALREARLAAPANETIMAALLPRARDMPHDVHPEVFLHGMLKARGYDTERRPALSTPYHREPTPEQTAAYDAELVRAVRDDNAALVAAMAAAGRRVDACNKYGESVLHMSCRRGNAEALRALLRGGGSVAVSDDYGRTPLHDACWTPVPAFDVVTILLNHDLKLLRIADKRGSTPLHYIRHEHWPLWCAFFDSKKELYWRQLGGQEADPDGFESCFGPAGSGALGGAGAASTELGTNAAGGSTAGCVTCV